MRIVTRIALLIVLASGCRKKAEPPPEPAPSQGVEMVSHGAMPHQTLRYQLTKGMKTAVEMEIDAEIATPTFQRTMPTTVMVMELGTDDVLPDGNAKVRTTILRASARERPGADASLEAANAQVMMLSGMTVTGTLTPAGKILEPRLEGGSKLPAQAAAQLASVVTQAQEIAMSLPEAGVGVGAIWRVRRETTQLGIKLQTMTEIQVTAIEDRRVTYAMRTEVKGDNQHTTIQGNEVDVTNVRGSGTGKGVVDLGRMVMFGEQSLELGFDLAAKQDAGSVKMRIAKRLKPASEPAAGEPPKPEPGAPPADEAAKPDKAEKTARPEKTAKPEKTPGTEKTPKAEQAPPDPGTH
jgi:hypothetical protein